MDLQGQGLRGPHHRRRPGRGRDHRRHRAHRPHPLRQLLHPPERGRGQAVGPAQAGGRRAGRHRQHQPPRPRQPDPAGRRDPRGHPPAPGRPRLARPGPAHRLAHPRGRPLRPQDGAVGARDPGPGGEGLRRRGGRARPAGRRLLRHQGVGRLLRQQPPAPGRGPGQQRRRRRHPPHAHVGLEGLAVRPVHRRHRRRRRRPPGRGRGPGPRPTPSTSSPAATRWCWSRRAWPT